MFYVYYLFILKIYYCWIRDGFIDKPLMDTLREIFKWKTPSSHWWSLEALELLFKLIVAIQTQITAIKITDSMNTIVTIQTFNHQSNSPNQWYVIRKAALITQQPKTLLPLHHCKNALTKEGECLKNRLRTLICSHERENSLPKGMR